MRSLSGLLLKNATSNVVRGVATAAVALALPHFLTHRLDPARFAAWSLILQIASYASFLDFGLQTAVARFLARAVEREDTAERDRLASTAFAMLAAAGLLAFVTIATIIVSAPALFPGVPAPLLGEFRAAALVLACGACITLPLSTWTGTLVGLHRNEFPALAIGGSRLLGAALVVALAGHTHSLVALTACLAATNLLGALAQGAAVRHLLPAMRFGRKHLHRATAAELGRTCAGLSVWSFGMLVVSGLDLSVVGHFRFSAVGVYSVAATLSLFFAGLNQSVTGALMTPLAALHARGRREEIATMVLRVTRLASAGNFGIAFGALLAGPALLRLWVGEPYASQAYPLLCVLAFAQAVRLTMNPYAVALVAVGQQTRTLLPSFLEAGSNASVSVCGMVAFGPIGVAAGTLAGACAGTAGILLHTVPRVWAELPISSRDLLREALVRPLLLVSPLFAATLLRWMEPGWTLPLTGLGLLTSVAVVLLSERDVAKTDAAGPALLPQSL